MDYSESQEDYCKRLLYSLNYDELRYIAFSVEKTDPDFFSASEISYDTHKILLVEFISKAIASLRVSFPYAALQICRHPCNWFTILTGQVLKSPPQADLHDFFLTNKEGWFGPLNDEETESSLYIYRRSVWDYLLPLPSASIINSEDNMESSDVDPDRTAEGKVLVHVTRPWHVILEIFPKYAVLSWEGFGYRTDETDSYAKQFPFWNDINSLLKEMPEWLPGLALIDPYSLVFNNLWDRYRNNPDYVWEDVATRSEQDGVAMNARSGGRIYSAGGSEASNILRGLAMLAERLAFAALRCLDLASEDKIELAREAVLEQIIKEGAIRSFEFAISHRQSKKFVFQSHIYFGAKPTGQDSLVHFKAYKRHGAASETSRFLAKELGVL